MALPGMIEPAAPDLFGGATAKQYWRGTQRACSPEETLERVAPYLDYYGITRVANVTGLDRIGIPTYMVVRPNSRSLSVTQGKGVDAPAAKVSGIMESIEAYHAEHPPCLTRLECYAALRQEVAVVDPMTLPLGRHSPYSAVKPIPWTAGYDLLRRETVWVPFELVHTNATLPRLPGSGCFVCSSNGLASGNTLGEAVLHGLCELIERDGLALWEQAPAADQARTRLDLSTVDDAVCRELLERYERAGVAVMAWDVSTDVGLPAFRVLIYDWSTDALLRPLGAAFGSGCHPDRAVALARALTEAAQSRLTAIAGSRDDQTRLHYRSFQAAAALDYYRELAAAGDGPLNFRAIPSLATASAETDVARVLDRLRAVGCRHAVVVDLSRPGLPAQVARIIVSGLEGNTESPSYRPGARARARVA